MIAFELRESLKERLSNLIGEGPKGDNPVYRISVSSTCEANSSWTEMTISRAQFDKWRNDLIERLSKDAAVLYRKPVGLCAESWTSRAHDAYEHTRTAILLDIQPIKNSTTDQKKIMRAMADYLTRNYPLMPYPDDEKYRANLAKEAYDFLNSEASE